MRIRIIALLLIPVFTFTNISLAVPLTTPDRDQLGPHYISQILSETQDELDSYFAATPLAPDGRTFVDRRADFEREWTEETAVRLAGKMVDRLFALEGAVQPEEGRDELVAAVREQASRVGVPEERVALLLTSLNRQFAAELLRHGEAVPRSSTAEDGPVAVAVSLGGTKFGAGVVDAADTLIATAPDLKWRDEYGADATPEALDNAIVRQVVAALEASAVPAERLTTIGVAFAGPVDEEAGIVGTPFKAPNLPYDHYPLRARLLALLRAKLKRPLAIVVEIYNDAKAALLGEMGPRGALAGQPAGGIMIIGTGVNATVARDGRPYFGRDNEINEVGHNLVGALGADGRWHYRYAGFETKGHHPVFAPGEMDLEDRCGGPHLDARFQEASSGRYAIKTITAAAAAGDAMAIALIDEAGEEIGRAIAAFFAAYQDEPFVRHLVLVSSVSENLGKGVTNAAGEDLFIAAVRRGTREELVAFGTDAGLAAELAGGIVRSTMTYERELVAFQPVPASRPPVCDAIMARLTREGGRDRSAQFMLALDMMADYYPHLRSSWDALYAACARGDGSTVIGMVNELAIPEEDKKLLGLLVHNLSEEESALNHALYNALIAELISHDDMTPQARYDCVRNFLHGDYHHLASTLAALEGLVGATDEAFVGRVIAGIDGLSNVDRAILMLAFFVPEGLAVLAKPAAREREIERIVSYMQRMLPDGDLLDRHAIMQHVVASNLDDERRLAYERRGAAHPLPPTFIFDGAVFPGYPGKEKPRFIAVTSSREGVAITSVFSKTEDPEYILAKGGCRWYRVGESDITSMDEKFKGNTAKNLDPLLTEGVRLGEAMLDKNPYWEVYFDGGKTIFLASETADKEAFVRDWVASSILAGSLMKLYIAGPDVYMGYDEMGWIEDEKGKALAGFGLPPTKMLATTSRDPKKYGTFPHEEWSVTSIGVVETMLTALQSGKLRSVYRLAELASGKLSLAVMGLGDVGAGVIWHLYTAYPHLFNLLNFRLIGNKTGSIMAPDGIDKAKLIDIVKRIRSGELDRDFDVREIFRDEIAAGTCVYIENPKDAYFCGADIVVPAARGTFILEEADIARMAAAGTKLYVEGANNSIAPGLEALFTRHGICLFDGPIANGGGIYCSKEEFLHALIEGELSMFRNAEDRRYHIQGDIADIAVANTAWLIEEGIAADVAFDAQTTSPYEIHRRLTSAIMTEKARLLDRPTDEERAEITRRSEKDFARGVERNAENLRILTIINATELAREHVITMGVNRARVVDQLASTNPVERRSALYWAGKLRVQEAYDVILAMLLDRRLDDTTRRLAAISLGYLENTSAITHLATLHGDPALSPEIRSGVEWALEQFGIILPDPSAPVASADVDELTAVIDAVRDGTRQMATHLLLAGADQAIDLGGVTVIMLKDMPARLTGERSPVIAGIVRQQYNLMMQEVRRLFRHDDGFIEVETQDELIARANALIAAGRKVVVLDDTTLTGTLPAGAIQGTAGQEYCVVTTEAIAPADDTEMPFVNLHAMSMMGVGVIYSDLILFEAAYRTFTGNEVPPDLVDGLRQRILWLIKALPRIVRFTTELGDIQKMKRLFDVAA